MKRWKELSPDKLYYINCKQGDYADRDIAERYWDIFRPNDAEEEPLSKYIQDIIIRCLNDFDSCCSEYSENCRQKQIEKDIISGYYGSEISRDYESLNDLDKYIILTFMKKYQDSELSKNIFDEVFFAMFGRKNNEYGSNERWDPTYSPYSAEKYYDKYNNIFYYFCAAEGDEKDAYNSSLFNVIKKLFADCTLKIRPVWGKYCIGMIECPEYEAACPRIGETQII